ncbi:MAG: class II aldolase/adducin family protein [Pirellulaceae bacterium]|nr:class II aldolase/adducin family protein [Planctomycetales bacterium]MCA9164153.1 class II aldolase/adducin family protein [Planctomycetales bacterium]MCA9202356.1 class II aldolase/adducin family protein [Planctomycetales bacterium]MCA9209458.1 class II aldolase/adducin family protein [Planctomycetales bacterium]MCA9224970.1 class II aldolase/adducin family protein [Planctomycetales bacterium]
MQNIFKIKQDICEIGRRIYNKGFAAANDGNITVRVSDNEVLCTPTMHSKGFLKPDDISVIDMTGKQISGNKKRSSEALLHLEIYKQREDIRSVVHCHPPHATAFAIAREPIPQCILPEVEVFLGDVPITKYETPGGQAFADTIIPFVDRTNVIILANHGTVSFGENVERAYWWTEILDAYCRMLILAKSLGRVNYLSEDKERELLELKSNWGWSDPRNTEQYKDCDICANDVFRESWEQTGVARRAFADPPAMGPKANLAGATSAMNVGQAPVAASPASSGNGSVDQEQLVRMITDRVMEALSQK